MPLQRSTDLINPRDIEDHMNTTPTPVEAESTSDVSEALPTEWRPIVEQALEWADDALSTKSKDVDEWIDDVGHIAMYLRSALGNQVLRVAAGTQAQPDAVAAMERDAARYRWLRDLQCNSLHLSRDDDNACNYMTAAQWIEEHPDSFTDDAPAEVELMKATNTIWMLQIYPNTPVGFNRWHGATPDAAIDAAILSSHGTPAGDEGQGDVA
jgi:hypothetical protein